MSRIQPKSIKGGGYILETICEGIVFCIAIAVLVFVIITIWPDKTRADDAPDSSYTVVQAKRFDTAKGVTRALIKVTIPDGLTRKQVGETLIKVVDTATDRWEFDAIIVMAYGPNDDVFGMYTAAQAVYAPYGYWEKAGEDGPMQTRIEYGSLYFADPGSYFAPGDQVELKAMLSGKTVQIYQTAGLWTDDNVLFVVPVGTPAIVRGRVVEAVSGDQKLVQYQIEVDGRRGWVLSGSVKSANGRE